MNLPPAIIFINSDPISITVDTDGYIDGYIYDGYTNKDGYAPDGYGYLNDITCKTLVDQLYLDGYMTLNTFNSYVASDGYFVSNIHTKRQRILVILPTFSDTTNRANADLVLFYNQGMVSVEKSNFGPPGLCLPISRINIYTLLRDVGNKFVTILPVTSTAPPHSLGGIVVDQLADASGVHDVNPDNEYNNLDFINRK